MRRSSKHIAVYLDGVDGRRKRLNLAPGIPVARRPSPGQLALDQIDERVIWCKDWFLLSRKLDGAARAYGMVCHAWMENYATGPHDDGLDDRPVGGNAAGRGIGHVYRQQGVAAGFRSRIRKNGNGGRDVRHDG